MSLAPPRPSSAAPSDSADLDLTIRFSASLPDLLLSVPASLNANTATLKLLIRDQIPAEYAGKRLRLIHAGKALVDDVPLASSLKRAPSRPPSRLGTPSPYADAGGDGGKGKSAVRDSAPPPPAAPVSRIYIHCSIGDITLTAAERAAESAAAQQTGDNSTTSSTTSSSSTTATTPSDRRGAAPPSTTTPAPRGFDRLLSAGFTAAEVQSLRLQFLSIQAHTHTPDTMPSPNTLRNMEDQWLDNSSGSALGGADGAGGAGAGGGGGGATDDDGTVGALDDMIWGTAMGFFWPVGCLVWGIREEGIWSQRRKMAVVVGVLLNVGLGIIRYSG